ncbi:MAG: alpha/beta hydrolase [Leptolyngbyaceae cyanobacterium CSU_1_4]|nr:alpha/beta hydrolase [Leptolyngbyaceae cyanobacterium CSU_1_4]
MMQHHEGTFLSADGWHLYYQNWVPADLVRGVIVIIHGLGGHSGGFSRIVENLVHRGYLVYGLDLRGHGRSPGQRGYINRWSEYREDLSRFLMEIQYRECQLPCFLLGHSLGALVVLDYSLRSPSQISGAIAIAPALRQVGVSPIKMLVGQILSQICPRFSLNTGIDEASASRDLAVLQTYARDPLRHNKGTARLATEFLVTTAWVWKHGLDLQVPLLVMHGEADRVTSASASYEFFRQISFSDKKWCAYTDGYHHLHDDFDYLEVLADLGNWLDQHLESHQSSGREKPSVSCS